MFVDFLEKQLKKIAAKRPPDFIIHPEQDYLRRWYVIPKNRFLNFYLHRVNASDDDRALHDHPWSSCSIILSGTYREITPTETFIRPKGKITFRSGSAMHRLEVVSGPVWTLFITGPKYREWGFDDPAEGWVHHLDYLDEDQQFGRHDPVTLNQS
jgi:hypothetical protein